MGARTKLNRAFFNGCAIVTGLIGMCSQSWLVFFIALVIALLLAIAAGDIRLTPKDHR
jgi:hypothetical protein